MKKISKNVIVFVVVLVLFLGGIVPKEVAFASTKSNISIKEKRKIELLCEEFRDFSGYYVYYKINNYGERTFDFSKEAWRREVIRFSYWNHRKLKKSGQKKLSKQLFGKSVSKKTKQLIGEWGIAWPTLKVKKINKLAKNKYKVQVVIYEENEDGKMTKMATSVFNIKKASKAKYGYYVTKIKIKKYSIYGAKGE